MVEFLIILLILVVIVYAVSLVIEQLQLPDAVRKLALLIIGVIALLIVLDRFGMVRVWR